MMARKIYGVYSRDISLVLERLKFSLENEADMKAIEKTTMMMSILLGSIKSYEAGK